VKVDARLAPYERIAFLDTGPENIQVETHGNLYAATAFLHAATSEEVSKRKLEQFDPAFPVTVAARAVAWDNDRNDWAGRAN
jgi:hypothetical protein